MNRRRFLSSVSAAALVGAFPLAAMITPAVKAATLKWYVTYEVVYESVPTADTKVNFTLKLIDKSLPQLWRVEIDAKR